MKHLSRDKAEHLNEKYMQLMYKEYFFDSEKNDKTIVIGLNVMPVDYSGQSFHVLVLFDNTKTLSLEEFCEIKHIPFLV